MAEHTFTVRYTEAVVRRAANRYFSHLLRRELPWALYLAIAALLCVLTYDLSRGRASWVDGALGTVVLLLPAIILIGYRTRLSEALARFRQMKTPTATFTATAEALTASSDAGSSTLPWRTFRRILEGEDFWLL